MKRGRRLLLCSNYPFRCSHSYPRMSRFIRAVPALCQAVFVAQLQVGRGLTMVPDMQGSIWNNKVPFDWLPVHKNGTSSCLSCSMGLYNQLLIKVAFWNSNSKTRLPHLSISLCFLFAWLPFHGFIYDALTYFWWVAIKVRLHEVVFGWVIYTRQKDTLWPLRLRWITTAHPIRL